MQHQFSLVYNKAYVDWLNAKQKRDFSAFAPSLNAVRDAELKRISLIDSEYALPNAYDNLLNCYERGMTSADLDAAFEECRNRLVPLLKKIQASKKHIRTDFLSRRVTDEQQKQMAQYLLPPEKDPGTGKRFCKPHRMMLLEGDIKNGPKIRKHPHSAQIKTYLIALLDDHSRFPPYSAFYSSETVKDTLDCLFQAIIRYGLPDAILYDNGSQYNAAYMKEICGRLGIRVRFCKVRHPWTKGVIERFNGVVSSFVAEVEVDKDRINSLEALNKEWEQYCCERYLNVPHEGIREYYEQRGVNVPKEGITPQQEWDRDTRALNIPELSVLSEAFTHRKTLKVDKTGNISFNKRKYYVDVEMRGQHVDVAVDLSDPKKTPDTLAVYLPGKDHNGKKLMDAKPLVIDENCSQKDLSVHTIKAQRKPKESRLLRVVEHEYQKRTDLKAGAVSYEAVWKKKDEEV